MEVVLASIPKESNIFPTILGIHVTSLQSWCDALENSEPLKQLCVVLFRLLEKEYLTYAFIFEWTKWCLFSNFDYFLWDIFPIIATSQIIRSFFDVAMYIYRGFLRKRASLRQFPYSVYHFHLHFLNGPQMGLFLLRGTG